MKTCNFKVVVEREDFDGNPSGWHAYCAALEKVGGSTWGETQEEALFQPSSATAFLLIEEMALTRFITIPIKGVTVLFHGGGKAFKRKTLKSMIEQARWNEDDLKRLKLLKKLW